MNRPENTPTHIGPFLRFIRKNLNLTLRQAANVAHVNFTYLAQVERSEKEPTDAWLTAYMRGLGVEIAARQMDGDAA